MICGLSVCVWGGGGGGAGRERLRGRNGIRGCAADLGLVFSTFGIALGY